MIRGALNDMLEPMFILEVLNGDDALLSVEALLDTGFTEDLTLPADMIARLGLRRVRRISATLADGQQISASVYAGFINWFGRMQAVDVIAAEGQPLLGMSLLLHPRPTRRRGADRRRWRKRGMTVRESRSAPVIYWTQQTREEATTC